MILCLGLATIDKFSKCLVNGIDVLAMDLLIIQQSESTGLKFTITLAVLMDTYKDPQYSCELPVTAKHKYQYVRAIYLTVQRGST
jgi:hypothetical protein